ncbi:secreted RxLR effector protein 161-like [Nicotiana tomentosiformis]|uniref:secreted RxLR effector protein 161-like n=1 Tax=Nicotiana tomentosiformis TaxID=4098 RepID=UPI00388C7AAC
MEFTLHQMDIKSAFLNGYLKEEVFAKKPPGFESEECPDHVYKLDKALYWLKQAPRAWCERLSKFLLEHGCKRGLCARFPTNPKESHLTVVKRILRYLKAITNLCLWYPKGSNFNLVGYADTDYTCFFVDSKSTSGMAHFLGSYLVSWATKKQNSVALSTAEAEYIAAALCCA